MTTITVTEVLEEEALSHLLAESEDAPTAPRINLIEDTLECMNQTGTVPLWVHFEVHLKNHDPEAYHAGVRFGYTVELCLASSHEEDNDG